jgi:hypothetical protein
MPDGTRIRLVPGKHSSPREGVCVVELASLIGGEDFSDRPRCVCPVIGAFLRGWNDRASHAERQRLAPYAGRIVGSPRNRQVTRERRDICLEWAGAELWHGPVRSLLTRIGMRLRIAVFCGLGAALRPNEGAGDYAARFALARADSQWAFELLETLLATGAERRPEQQVATAGNGHATLNRNGLPAKGRIGLPAANGNGSTGRGNGSTGNGAPPLVGELDEESSNGSEESSRPATPAAGSGRPG